jgi:fermentation-respiration switch protein FrsA (DUF1100 family)
MEKNIQQRKPGSEMQLALLLLKFGYSRPRKNLILIIIILPLVFITACSSLFFYPQKAHRDNQRLRQATYSDVYFRTSDRLILHAWYLKGQNAKRGTILFLHGNAENISTHINNVLWLTEFGYDVFAFDYRGYGKSAGHPTIKGVHIDAQAAIETILNLTQKDDERVIILGQSLGGAIAVYATANSSHKNRIKALIVESTFSDYKVIAREKLALFTITRLFQYPVASLFADEHSPIKWMKRVAPVPVLILHGDTDTIVPLHHSLVLYNEALPPKDFWQVKDAGHIQAFASKEARERLLEYLKSLP